MIFGFSNLFFQFFISLFEGRGEKGIKIKKNKNKERRESERARENKTALISIADG
jgi:hypothetical protein